MEPFDLDGQEEAGWAARAARDRQAFAPLYDRYFTRVYNYLRFRCPDPQAADDLTAQVFERALARIDTYSPRTAPFGAWLFAIARHALSDYRRAQRARSILSLEALRQEPVERSDPEVDLIQAERRHALLNALSGLSERERDLVALKFAAGLNNRQIAGLTGLSESNVGVSLYRAMQRMRKVLVEQATAGQEEIGYG